MIKFNHLTAKSIVMKIKSFVIRLDSEHYLKDQEKINSFLENVVFKKSSVSFVDDETKFWTVLIHYEEIQVKEQIPEMPKSETKIIITESDLNSEELEIVSHLKKWRIQKAEKEDLPLFMILSNSDIYAVAKAKPKRIEDFIGLKGFGEKKTARYGDEIIALLNSV